MIEIKGVEIEKLISHISRILLELLCLFYLLSKRKVINTHFVKLVCVWILLMIPVCLIDYERAFVNATSVLFWPLIFLFFCSLIDSDPNHIKKATTFFCCLFFLVVILYIGNVMDRNQGIENKLASINRVYYLLLLAPWLLSVNNRTQRHIFLLILVMCAFISAKRGAIVITLFITLFYIGYLFFIESKKVLSKNNRSRKNRFWQLTIFLCLLSAGYIFFSKLEARNDNYLLSRFESIEEDQGSGRFVIFKTVIEAQMNSSWEYWLIGHGNWAVKQDITVFNKSFSAHNDYLEILYDYGIICLILYFYIFIILFKRLKFLYKVRSDYFMGYSVGFIIFTIMPFLSPLVLYPTYFIYLTAYWGAMEAIIVDIEKKKSRMI